VHGDSALTAVERITAAIFSNQIEALTEQDFAQLAQDGLPSSHFDLSEVGLLTLLVESGLATTPKGEVTQGQARKLIMGNSVAVNGVKQIDPEFKLQANTARYGRYHLVQKGKKQHHLVVLKG
jgi:tyrosyl-tRNA synthetase